MTSRRQFLSTLPVVALAVAACGSKQTAEEVRQSVGPPPNPKTPDEAIKVLAEGNARFAARTPQIRETADIELLWSTGIYANQEPFATVLGCADSRLAPELIFDQFVATSSSSARPAISPTHPPTSAASSTARRC